MITLDSVNKSQAQALTSSESKVNSLNFDTSTQPAQLVFVDPSVADYQQLIAGVRDAKVVILDADQDGVKQITDVLSHLTDVAGVHILSHGSAAHLRLGSADLSSDSLAHYAADLQHWSAALTPDADILFYGCNVAAGQAGTGFVRQLSQLTTADVAASTDLTGSAAKGGDWDLESTTGSIETALAFQPWVLQRYDGTLLDAKFNFQPDSTLVPTGYTKDIGQAYSDARGYGWVTQASLSSATHTPLDLTPNTRDRDLLSDQRLDTFIHMQYLNSVQNTTAVRTPAAWEYAVPNGQYTVTVSVGDAANNFDSQNKINVEGIEAIPLFTPNSTQKFKQNSVVANVTDGKLTIDAIGGSNTKLNYVDIQSVTAGSDTTAPTASLTAANLTAAGGSTYDFSVTYSDNTAVNVSTLDAGDLQVTGPTGVVQPLTLVSLNDSSNGSPRTATYRITAPGGSWDAADNGTYAVALLNNQVSDTAANFAPAASLGNFMVNIGSVSPANIKFNFQPDSAPVPTGYTKDIGQAYSDARGYGWVTQASLSSATHTPLDLTPNTRDRNRAGIDQRLDTFIHMQFPSSVSNATAVRTPGAWEYAVPNGQYSVTVSVGDQPAYDSQNVIHIEGVDAIPSFQGNSVQEYELGTATVNVTDGKLTIDAIGGTNTKLNYVEVKNLSSGSHPSVSGSSPSRRQAAVNLNAAVNLDVSLVSVGAGVDATTLTTNNIQLYRTRDNALVPGNINTTGGNDAIVYQPTVLLDPNTSYSFRLGDGVRDQAGNAFLPFSTTFSTGTTGPGTTSANFAKSQVFSGPPVSSLAVSPGGSYLYAAALDGVIRRWSIDSSGSLTNLQTFSGLVGNSSAPRAIIGIAFDPTNPNVLWVSHNNSLFAQPADDFSGKISKLTLQSGSTFGVTVQDYVVGLPRSGKDHMSNSLAFGPDGKLYMTQGSNSAMGAPDATWYQRPERLLSGSVLQIDPNLTPPSGGFNVQTENYGSTTGNYNPFAPNAPVKIYATGIRNAYDLVWHSNGLLYTPTNGSAAGGNTPDNPNTAQNEGLTNVGTQNDYLFKVVQDGYYGHPNPLRQQYILNGGNPTSGVDPAQVVAQGSNQGYAVGTQPDPNYKGFAYDFGRNRSPDGAIEYKSNTFSGALKNKLLVVEYSGGDDIVAISLDASGNVSGATQVASGFVNPLDLVEDPLTGDLYVAELLNENTGEGRISLLKPA